MKCKKYYPVRYCGSKFMAAKKESSGKKKSCFHILRVLNKMYAKLIHMQNQ